MKSIKLIITGIVLLLLVFSCSGDKTSTTIKVEKQQSAIDEKIKEPGR